MLAEGAWQIFGAKCMLGFDAILMLIAGLSNNFCIRKAADFWTDNPRTLESGETVIFSEEVQKTGAPANVLLKTLGFNHISIAIYLALPLLLGSLPAIGIVLLADSLHLILWLVWANVFLQESGNPIDEKIHVHDHICAAVMIIGNLYFGTWLFFNVL